MYCSNCGAEVTGKFCANCGTPINENSAQQLQPIQSMEETVLVPAAFHATKKCGQLEVDEAHQLWKVKNASSDIVGKSKGSFFGKAALAVATGGLSLAAGAAVSAINKATHKDGIYSYNDLINFDLLEDNTAITSGGVGRALVGGAIFGRVGAVVGGITGPKKSKKIVEHLVVKITVNDFNKPCIMIPLLSKPASIDSKEYREAFRTAHIIISTLDLISKNVATK